MKSPEVVGVRGVVDEDTSLLYLGLTVIGPHHNTAATSSSRISDNFVGDFVLAAPTSGGHLAVGSDWKEKEGLERLKWRLRPGLP